MSVPTRNIISCNTLEKEVGDAKDIKLPFYPICVDLMGKVCNCDGSNKG